jgi:hypothetical protein
MTDTAVKPVQYVIVNAGRIDFAMQQKNDPRAGWYLQAVDIEAENNDDAAIWTTNKDDAMRFSSMLVAMNMWRQISRTRPVRRDGEPNRPLTLWSITLQEV